MCIAVIFISVQQMGISCTIPCLVILSGVKRSRRIFAPNVCSAVTKVRRFFDSLTLAQNDRFDSAMQLFDKLEFIKLRYNLHHLLF